MTTPRERNVDVLVVGGGVGGVAAAMAAARNGCSVLLTEETPWLGGQLTSQAVPPDEHPWIEQTGCTRTYRRLRDTIRSHYKEHYPLTERARSDPRAQSRCGLRQRTGARAAGCACGDRFDARSPARVGRHRDPARAPANRSDNGSRPGRERDVAGSQRRQRNARVRHLRGRRNRDRRTAASHRHRVRNGGRIRSRHRRAARPRGRRSPEHAGRQRVLRRGPHRG